jgi:mono/diheme cytochrome c family protein
MTFIKTTAARAASAIATLSLALTSHADDFAGRAPAAWPQTYVRECSACHVAYPPRMLPAVSWARLMAGLDKHFTTDASLDEREVRQLSQWLQDNADRRASPTAPAEDRITRTAWFERKHRCIEPATWRLASVRSAANCAACHVDAHQGRYSEHHLRMPEGLSACQRERWGD